MGICFTLVAFFPLMNLECKLVSTSVVVVVGVVVVVVAVVEVVLGGNYILSLCSFLFLFIIFYIFLLIL